uniref:Uncharacterized protein n=2 Tax=Vibrionaceae TaxID=641 RepID=A0A0H3ZY54_VIBSP|nr:hypothetical protein [Vibrio splendidus]AKN40585.1 hypothetical protein [Enterovibrio norvegicus]
MTNVKQKIESLKLVLLQRSEPLSYQLSKSNHFYQNLSRIEAIRAEMAQAIENGEVNQFDEVFLKHWIDDLEIEFCAALHR